jgi:hypothetical protein
MIDDLVKRLRATADHTRAGGTADLYREAAGTIERLTRERDEARATVERLTGAFDTNSRLLALNADFIQRAEAAEARIAKLEQERDEARAECASDEAREEGYREGQSDAGGAQADLWSMLIRHLHQRGVEPASDDGEGHTAYQMMDALHECEHQFRRAVEKRYADLAASRITALEAENARLREALEYYADTSDYTAPQTGGNGKLYFDCGLRARAALEAIAPAIRAEALEEERKRFKDPRAADWYWRDLDPDDSGYSINEAIHMMGEGVVCHVRSSFTGPDFFAAIVPVLDADSDDTEEIVADTADECVMLVQERYAAIRAMKDKTDD